MTRISPWNFEPYTWHLVAGQDTSRTFDYSDSNGDPIPLVDYTVECYIDIGGHAEIIAGTLDEVTSTITVTIPHETTDLFTVSQGSYRVFAVSPEDERVPIAYGALVTVR